MSLGNVSTADLEAARVDLDHQMRALKSRKAEIAAELERRLPGEEPEDRVVSGPQTVEPGFVESEAQVPQIGGRKRRWGRQGGQDA